MTAEGRLELMGLTNEVLRQFVGKAAPPRFDALDYWNQTYNRRAAENEVKKLDAAGKPELAKELQGPGREGRDEGAGSQDVTVQTSAPALVTGLPQAGPPLVRVVAGAPGRGHGGRAALR